MDCVFYYTRRGSDNNNSYKLLCDALEKIVYDNDSRVLVRTQRVLYDTKKLKVLVRFKPVNYIGIFNNQEQLDEFKSNQCTSCRFYRKGSCSILKSAMNG